LLCDATAAVFFLVLALCLSLPVAASETHAEVVDNTQTIELPLEQRLRLHDGQLALYEDPTGALDFTQVQQAWDAGLFRRAEAGQLNFGITQAAIWVRLKVSNPSSEYQRILLSHDYAPMDNIRLFCPLEDGGVEQWQAGDSVPVSDGMVKRRLANFDLRIGPGKTQVVYLRIRSNSNVNAELSAWPPEVFLSHENFYNLAYGLLFGAIVVTVLNLLFAWFLSRAQATLVLAAYLTSYGAYLGFFNGYPQVWAPAALLPHVNDMHLATMGLLFGFGALFYRRYLQIATINRGVDVCLQILQWMGFAVVFSPILPFYIIELLLFIVAGATPALTSAYAFYLWYKRVDHAGIFAIGWFVAHLSSILAAMRIGGSLPNEEWLWHLPALGCALAFMCFTGAVALRLSREVKSAYLDFLTGIANRRQLEQVFQAEFERARRYDRPLSVIVVDVDHFKRVNDEHGHALGDNILKDLAQRCQRLLRGSDLAARIGGEEFAILLIETDGHSALTVAERLRRSQAGADEGAGSVTLSLGVSELLCEDSSMSAIMERADEALYKAKSGGRNRVEGVALRARPAGDMARVVDIEEAMAKGQSGSTVSHGD
tara:strand:- start:94115 stop:95911 length:1797 start_codon:yes stop_codon:yes gene_type:complete